MRIPVSVAPDDRRNQYELSFHIVSKTIRQTHRYISAGGTDAAAVGAVAFVGDVLERCIERETAGELQRCTQVEREPCR